MNSMVCLNGCQCHNCVAIPQECLGNYDESQHEDCHHCESAETCSYYVPETAEVHPIFQGIIASHFGIKS